MFVSLKYNSTTQCCWCREHNRRLRAGLVLDHFGILLDELYTLIRAFCFILNRGMNGLILPRVRTFAWSRLYDSFQITRRQCVKSSLYNHRTGTQYLEYSAPLSNMSVLDFLQKGTEVKGHFDIVQCIAQLVQSSVVGLNHSICDICLLARQNSCVYAAVLAFEFHNQFSVEYLIGTSPRIADRVHYLLHSKFAQDLVARHIRTHCPRLS